MGDANTKEWVPRTGASRRSSTLGRSARFSCDTNFAPAVSNNRSQGSKRKEPEKKIEHWYKHVYKIKMQIPSTNKTQMQLPKELEDLKDNGWSLTARTGHSRAISPQGSHAC